MLCFGHNTSKKWSFLENLLNNIELQYIPTNIILQLRAIKVYIFKENQFYDLLRKHVPCSYYELGPVQDPEDKNTNKI